MNAGRVRGTAWALAASALAACHGAPQEPTARPVSSAPSRAPAVETVTAVRATASAAPPVEAALGASEQAQRDALEASYRLPAAPRVVAIGDLHGDLAAARSALRVAGAVDAQDRWVGGRLVVVQTGDEIDRADDDRAIVELFDRLADAAEGAGGKVVPLVGNHEVMNVSLDFRYVTPGGFKAFADVDATRVPAAVLQQFPVEARGRVAAFIPGGPFARRLASRRAVVVVGDTAFVHGGITAEHVAYGIPRFNREVSRFMSGEGAAAPLAGDTEGPLWTRRYSDDTVPVDCAKLREALTALHVSRLVVGHTVHKEGISPACDGAVWRIDTGQSAFYGGPTEVLEIRGATVKPLKGTK